MLRLVVGVTLLRRVVLLNGGSESGDDFPVGEHLCNMDSIVNSSPSGSCLPKGGAGKLVPETGNPEASCGLSRNLRLRKIKAAPGFAALASLPSGT